MGRVCVHEKRESWKKKEGGSTVSSHMQVFFVWTTGMKGVNGRKRYRCRKQVGDGEEIGAGEASGM